MAGLQDDISTAAIYAFIPAGVGGIVGAVWGGRELTKIIYSDIENTAVPATNDVVSCTLAGMGLGLIPAAVIMSIPIIGNIGFNVSSDMWSKYKDKAYSLEKKLNV